VKPRVLFVGRSRLQLPLPEWLAKKWDAVAGELDYRLLGAARSGATVDDGRFRLRGAAARFDALRFYAALPFEIRRELRAFRPDVVIAADPYVGAAALLGRALAGRRPRLVVEVHGDPRTFTRGYGSRLRKLLSPAADAVARYALRRADATRALSAFTSSIVEETRGEPATEAFPTYSDLSAFTANPPVPVPAERTVAFVAALERYKNVQGMAAAWRRVAAELPDARLIVVGNGSQRHVVDALVRDLPAQVEHHPELAPDEVAAVFDRSRALVLPSWPEGLGRVVIEAFARGRGVVATAAGGVLDLVTDHVEGLLIPPADTDALVRALRRVLTDDALAERLGAAGLARYGEWHATADDFARSYRRLVDRALER
jgi:glycosyltransferase involved in cell wall biosynthesis